MTSQDEYSKQILNSWMNLIIRKKFNKLSIHHWCVDIKKCIFHYLFYNICLLENIYFKNILHNRSNFKPKKQKGVNPKQRKLWNKYSWLLIWYICSLGCSDFFVYNLYCEINGHSKQTATKWLKVWELIGPRWLFILFNGWIVQLMYCCKLIDMD